ncbi:MAG: hypothetical protein JOZ07_19585 [Solirubrobacterales bacterium]|nr:hypothetical protein [Solirubrobacterales bacterium]
MRGVGLLRLGGCLGLLALALAGCTSAAAPQDQSSVTVPGSTLSVYSAQPPGPASAEASDVLDAERLALRQQGGHVGTYSVMLAPVHEDETSADARAAVSDPTAIAYLGELAPGTSGVSIQITNQLGLLQISPADTAVYLTRSDPAVAGSPGHFYPSSSTYHRTFARVVPSTAAEAEAIVARLRAQRLATVDVVSDGQPYGTSIAAEVRVDARGAGLQVTSSPTGAGAVFYAGAPGAAARAALDRAAAAAPRAKLFAPSALYDPAFVSSLSAPARSNLTISVPGFTARTLTAQGRRFTSAFDAAYGHEPQPEAIFGYEAMASLLAVLHSAGSEANRRSVVVSRYLGLRNRVSVLGTYSISGGDTSIAPFIFVSPTDALLSSAGGG